jgi:hypothetical protein
LTIQTTEGEETERRGVGVGGSTEYNGKKSKVAGRDTKGKKNRGNEHPPTAEAPTK